MFNTLAFAMPLRRSIGAASVIIAFWAAGGVAAVAQTASPPSFAMANDAGLSDADNPTAYVRTDLVSNTQYLAQPFYPNLQNAWGVANAPGGLLWVSDNIDGLSTLYDGNGVRTNLTITVPLPAGKSAPPTATPTGMVWNPTSAFTITVGSTTVLATFIFDTEDGTISAWNATVDSVRANGLSTATLIVDHSASGAVYKGLVFGTNTHGNFLFATNFAAAGGMVCEHI